MLDHPDGYSPKQQRIRAEIAETGATRLLTEALNRLLSSVAPAAIAQQCGISPDTVHRLVGDREAVLEFVTQEVVTNLEFQGNDWPSFSGATGRAAEKLLDGLPKQGGADEKTIQPFLDAVGAYIDAAFEAPAHAAGALIEAAVLVSGPRWTGADLIDPDLRHLADRLRELRADHLQRTSDGLVWLLTEAMAEFERRPQQGMTPKTLLILMNCLVDGAVTRMLIDPDSLDTATVAEAALRLGIAYTEPGSFDDPHEPEDPQGRRTFAAIIDAATDLWRVGDLTLEQVADSVPDIDVATVERWFPTVHQLSDSVVRRRVASAIPGPSESDDALVTMLEAVLRRLCLAADSVPGAVREAFAPDAPTTSIATQITGHALAVVEAQNHPALLAEELVHDACEGSSRWPRIKALLHLLERPAGGDGLSG